MISATLNHLNITKDDLPPTISQYNESNCPTIAVQHYNQNLDSSESIPSEHSSIYEAPVASFEMANHESEVGQIANGTVGSVIGIDYPNISSGQSDTAHVRFADNLGPHGTRPWNAIEKTTEQRNAVLLGPQASVLRASPEVLMRGPKLPPPTLSSSRRRDAFSLDDMDTRISKRKQAPSHQRLRRLDSSSSSSDALGQGIPLREFRSPVDPVLPALPPPVRIPTPPGLPSFGSPEAMRYRQQSRRSRGPCSSSRSSQQPPMAPSQGTTDVGAGSNGCAAFPSLGRSLKRFFLSWADPQPAPLAPGVVGRAEDGTFVRARFGTRQSGHGIGASPGSRGLEAHPFHRRTLPVARTNEAAQVDGSPHGSREEGQLSRPEAFAPPRAVRASSSSSHSSLPFSNGARLPQLRFPSNIKPRTSSNASPTAAGQSYFTFRDSDLRLPRISEMTTSRADNIAHPAAPNDQVQETQEPNSSPFQTNTAERYSTQFRDFCSVFCCRTVVNEREEVDEIINRGRRPRQVDGSGDVPVSNAGRVRNGSPAMGRSAGLGSRPLTQHSGNSPWTPAWGCRPGSFGVDGASEDE